MQTITAEDLLSHANQIFSGSLTTFPYISKATLFLRGTMSIADERIDILYSWMFKRRGHGVIELHATNGNSSREIYPSIVSSLNVPSEYL